MVWRDRHIHLYGPWQYTQARDGNIGRSRACINGDCNVVEFEPLGNRNNYCETEDPNQ